MQQEWRQATFDANLMQIRLGHLYLPAELDPSLLVKFLVSGFCLSGFVPFPIVPTLFCAGAAPSPLACASSAAQTALLHCPPASLLLRRMSQDVLAAVTVTSASSVAQKGPVHYLSAPLS